MDSRYENLLISDIWSYKSKYQRWLDVEMAILMARNKLGLVENEILESISKKVFITDETVMDIEEKEKVTKHDLVAFVRVVKNMLSCEEEKYIHADGVTSYDIEEPAMSLMMISSINVVLELLESFKDILKALAKKYKYLKMMGHTHGQCAQIYTLGVRFLKYSYDVSNCISEIKHTKTMMFESKISGAIGCYNGGLSPMIEEQALLILGLSPAKFSRQIMLRDKIAYVLSSMAITGAVLEKIAIDFRLASISERCELQEPFSKGQTGSSVMPFKKNPITMEKITGIARMLRANQMVAIENIATWEERDISHSCTERVIIPDSFHLLTHMISQLSNKFKNMKVNKERINLNVERNKDLALIPFIKQELIKNGYSSEESYRYLQEAFFESFNTDTPISEILDIRFDIEAEKMKTDKKVNDLVEILFKR